VRKLDATERKTLVGVFFLAGCLLLAPKQWVSAGALIALGVGMFVMHVRRSRRERLEAEATKDRTSLEDSSADGEAP